MSRKHFLGIRKHFGECRGGEFYLKFLHYVYGMATLSEYMILFHLKYQLCNKGAAVATNTL